MLKTVIPAIALTISLLATQSAEAAIVVTCTTDPLANSPCLQGPFPNSWYISAIGENEPPSEQNMTLSFFGTGSDQGISYREVIANGRTVPRPAVGHFDVLEPDGSLSDQVFLFGGSINNILIASDPSLALIFGDNLGTLATEGESGATATMVMPLTTELGSPLGISLGFIFGFDGELVFPFGSVADTSDFVRVIVPAVPEPPSLAVLGFGLAALAYLLHRRRSGFNYSI